MFGVAYCADKRQKDCTSDTVDAACCVGRQPRDCTADMSGVACCAGRRLKGCNGDSFGVSLRACRSWFRHIAGNLGVASHVDTSCECAALQGVLVAFLQLANVPYDHSGARSTFDISYEL